ncbi:unnamed protein product [Musa acuminata subsp. burmannicoides]
MYMILVKRKSIRSRNHNNLAKEATKSSREGAIKGSQAKGAPWFQSPPHLLQGRDLLPGLPPQSRNSERSQVVEALLSPHPMVCLLPARLAALLEVLRHQQRDVRHCPKLPPCKSSLVCCGSPVTDGARDL